MSNVQLQLTLQTFGTISEYIRQLLFSWGGSKIPENIPVEPDLGNSSEGRENKRVLYTAEPFS